jgi:hypothetical protein
VQVLTANGTVQTTTQSDPNGSFIISGLPAGDYRLVVSNPAFETKEIPVTIGPTGAPAPLRISLAVGPVSSSITVQGREDSLVGIAESATQGTVGASEIEDRPILRSGEVMETIPGVIITQHAGGGKANQYFLRGFNLDHGTDIAISLDGMPLNLPSHAHGEGYSDMNTVIPEFVERTDFQKGPYYADVGNYGSAASANVVCFKTLTENRVRVDKTDSDTGATLPATTEADRFTDTQVGVYVENKIQWAEKFRTDAALRGDVGHVDVTSLVSPANSGTATKLLPSPKLSLIFGPWSNAEFYVQGGFSFHSNDARGATQTVEPVSADNPYPNTPSSRIPLLIPTKGAEIGVRTSAVAHVQSTVSLWYLRSQSELQQDGDTGGTVASLSPSNRYGVELANYYTPVEHLTFDFDLAESSARFTQ